MRYWLVTCEISDIVKAESEEAAREEMAIGVRDDLPEPANAGMCRAVELSGDEYDRRWREAMAWGVLN